MLFRWADVKLVLHWHGQCMTGWTCIKDLKSSKQYSGTIVNKKETFAVTKCQDWMLPRVNFLDHKVKYMSLCLKFDNTPKIKVLMTWSIVFLHHIDTRVGWTITLFVWITLHFYWITLHFYWITLHFYWITLHVYWIMCEYSFKLSFEQCRVYAMTKRPVRLYVYIKYMCLFQLSEFNN